MPRFQITYNLIIFKNYSYNKYYSFAYSLIKLQKSESIEGSNGEPIIPSISISLFILLCSIFLINSHICSMLTIHYIMKHL
jgi:hypothetical protein